MNSNRMKLCRILALATVFQLSGMWVAEAQVAPTTDTVPAGVAKPAPTILQQQAQDQLNSIPVLLPEDVRAPHTIQLCITPQGSIVKYSFTCISKAGVDTQHEASTTFKTSYNGEFPYSGALKIIETKIEEAARKACGANAATTVDKKC